MAFINKGDEIVVETLETLDESNLSRLTTSELEQLTEFSGNLPADMEHQEEEELSTIESEEMQEVIIQQEVEPAMATKKVIVPPLRPLTIAPKPTKVPISFKPVAGQQLLLVQGGSSGQQLKLLSGGPGINLTNFTMAKPVTIKATAGKGAVSLPQTKQVIMKKVMTQVPKTIGKVFENKSAPQIVMVQKSEPQTVKLVQSSTISTTPAKTLTLAQAQQMGLISGSKIITQGGASKQIILNKSPSKTIKIVPQIKSPTKILPAPQQTAATKGGQRIVIKPSGAATASNSLLANQIIQMTGGAQALNTGQLHQINIPGKGMQYIKFITTTQAQATTTNANVNTVQSVKTPKTIPVTTTPAVKSGNIVLSELKAITKQALLTPKIVKTSTPVQHQQQRPVTVNISTATGNQVVVLSTNFVSRTTPAAKVPIPAIKHATPPVKPAPAIAAEAASTPATPESPDNPVAPVESNGMRPRKPCNCTKSQCLKLYCDCFANGEFCYMCNCMNCYNNLENEEHRQRAIKNCLERNPNAFRPKIGKAREAGDAAIRKHTKGCNCKRSGCLKNYCECYEAKIACSSNCKCVGCRNIEDCMDKKGSRTSILSESSFSLSPQVSRKSSVADLNLSLRTRRATTNNNKQAFNYITNEVIEATSQCLLSLSKNAEETEEDEEVTKKQLIEEFGRCLKEIIDCSIQKNQQAKASAN